MKCIDNFNYHNADHDDNMGIDLNACKILCFLGYTDCLAITCRHQERSTT